MFAILWRHIIYKWKIVEFLNTQSKDDLTKDDLSKDYLTRNTVPTQNSDTQNSDILQNSDKLFALTKMSLFWQQEDFLSDDLWSKVFRPSSMDHRESHSFFRCW